MTETKRHPVYLALSESSERHGEQYDCGVIALAAVTGVSYTTARAALRAEGRLPRAPTQGYQLESALRALGFRRSHRHFWVGRTVCTIGKEYPEGRCLVFTRDHVLAMVNSIILDWTEGRRHRVREVWGVKRDLEDV